VCNKPWLFTGKLLDAVVWASREFLLAQTLKVLSTLFLGSKPGFGGRDSYVLNPVTPEF
jgi:hypothetical protein